MCIGQRKVYVTSTTSQLITNSMVTTITARTKSFHYSFIGCPLYFHPYFSFSSYLFLLFVEIYIYIYIYISDHIRHPDNQSHNLIHRKFAGLDFDTATPLKGSKRHQTNPPTHRAKSVPLSSNIPLFLSPFFFPSFLF